MSEQEVLDIRAKLRAADDRPRRSCDKIPIEIGLMTEEGYPHKGHLDYVARRSSMPRPARSWCAACSTIRDRTLLPGFFVRVRVPTDIEDKAALLVPDRVLAEDQAGRYLLVVNKDDVVEQRRVTTGLLLPGGLRVIDERPEAGRPGRGQHQRARDSRAARSRPRTTTIQAAAPTQAPAK